VIVRNGDIYRIDFAFDKGGASANLQALDLPALMRELGTTTTELALAER
jgi:tRNA A-37 threonylcarbamoyl transferase component Bud32